MKEMKDFLSEKVGKSQRKKEKEKKIRKLPTFLIMLYEI